MTLEERLAQIDAQYVDNIFNKQAQVDQVQFTYNEIVSQLNNLIAQKQEKISKAYEYFDAVGKKNKAQEIIDHGM